MDKDRASPPSAEQKSANPGVKTSAAKTSTASGTRAQPGTGSQAGDPGRSSGPQQKSAKSGSWRGKAVVIVILAALVAGAYYLWPYYGDELKSRLGFTQEAANSETPLAAQSGGAVSAIDEEFPSQQSPAVSEEDGSPQSEAAQPDNHVEERLADLQLALDALRNDVSDLSTTNREDWLLAEAEYLLRLANQRLLTERQTQNAIGLMTSADTILRDLDDVELFAVRKALAEDITALRMAGMVDREGIYLALNALIGAVDQLPLPVPHAMEPTPEEAPENESATWYQRLGNNTWQALGKLAGLVRIERRDQPLAPLVSLEEEQLLRYNLRVMLEQAQLAMLREEQGIFDASLERAEAWVNEHFSSGEATTAFLDSLAALQGLDVVQPLPSASASLKALQDVIQSTHNRYKGVIGEETAR